jgi:hypothetical protein
MIVEVSFVFRKIKIHPIFSSPSQEFIIMIPWIVIAMLVAWIPPSVYYFLGDDSAPDTGTEEELHAREG